MKTCGDSVTRFIGAMKMAVTQSRHLRAATPKTARFLIPMILNKSVVPRDPSKLKNQRS